MGTKAAKLRGLPFQEWLIERLKQIDEELRQRSKRQRRYRRRHPEEIKERKKQDYQKHKAKRREYQRTWYLKRGAGLARKRYLKNREAILRLRKAREILRIGTSTLGSRPQGDITKEEAVIRNEVAKLRIGPLLRVGRATTAEDLEKSKSHIIKKEDQ